MSFWYEPKRKDLDIDGDDVNVYLGQDYNGAIYAAIKIKDLKEILSESDEPCIEH